MGATGIIVVNCSPNTHFDMNYSSDFAVNKTEDNMPKSTVTGQAGILTSSDVEAWIVGSDFTTDNPIDSHIYAAMFGRPVVTNIVAGQGFDVMLAHEDTLTGDFKIRWVWN